MNDFIVCGLAAQMDAEQLKSLAVTLEAWGFFDAPASTKYHGAHEGGLYEHSYNVWDNLLRLTNALGLRWLRGKRSVFLVAFLHDLCKADQYVLEEDGTYNFNKRGIIKGHGDKSVILCNLLPITLTEEEIACIMYHMGAFVEKEKWSEYTDAVHMYPNVLWTHTADMMAAHIDEVEG